MQTKKPSATITWLSIGIVLVAMVGAMMSSLTHAGFHWLLAFTVVLILGLVFFASRMRTHKIYDGWVNEVLEQWEEKYRSPRHVVEAVNMKCQGDGHGLVLAKWLEVYVSYADPLADTRALTISVSEFDRIIRHAGEGLTIYALNMIAMGWVTPVDNPGNSAIHGWGLGEEFFRDVVYVYWHKVDPPVYNTPQVSQAVTA
jgi:hypothetical protein